MVEAVKISQVERIKEASRGLRGGIAAAVAADAPMVADDDQQLLKFHGSYGQYDRDTATELKKQGKDKQHSFMVRVRIPGGRLSGGQYLALDDLAGDYANGSLRITTRQTIQFHGVVGAQNLKRTIKAINDRVTTTLATCGDVVRNVTTTPAPRTDAVHRRLRADAQRISEAFLPKTTGYAEIWLDGAPQGEEVSEPLYGKTFLPRKFKIGITVPEDNSIDVLTNDLAIIALFDGEVLQGYNFYLGGGLGMNHNKPSTYPRLASPIAFFGPDELLEGVEAVVKLHRDHGDRGNRKHARLKYVVAENGLEWTRRTLSGYVGRNLPGPRPFPTFSVVDHLTWQPQGDGGWYLGLPVPSGRIADVGSIKLRSALRAVVRDFGLNVVFTPNQDVILADVPARDRFKVAQALRKHGVALAADVPVLQRWALACPALPTCGLALSEAERVKEPLIESIEAVYGAAGLGGEPLTIRITGCPNGCARPYSAEIGLVGRMADTYALFLGGAWNGTRLARKVADKIKSEQLPEVLAPIFALYARARQPGERFGDFIAGRDPAEIEQLIVDVVGAAAIGPKPKAVPAAPQRLAPADRWASEKAEAARQAAEAARLEAEALRRQGEETLAEARAELDKALAARRQAEALRLEAVAARQEAEASRAEAEAARAAASDQGRAAGQRETEAEAAKAAAEAAHGAAQTAREQAEAVRNSAEEDRRRAEDDRRQADADRRQAEADRRRLEIERGELEAELHKLEAELAELRKPKRAPKRKPPAARRGGSLEAAE